jgi:dipeptidyl aminopeptidase/acylaminoacyl peptidase
MPGEDAVRKSELFVYDRETKKLARVGPKWKDEIYTNPHWGKTSKELRFIRTDRLVRHGELCALNTVTGEIKCLIAEGFENAHLSTQTIRYLEESGEMIWWSERSGWGHYYLYDRDGKLKNAITSGSYRAGRIVDVDPQKRLLYFTGNGREPGENIYNEHLYCVHLDGTGLTLMDPGNANHRSSLSPSRQFVVDNCSRVDLAPKTVLRRASGEQIMVLEEADLSKLHALGWKLPETFTVKAADGVTDLYGNMWKPFDFDPNRKYPIIAHVYPGPQMEGTTHTFTALAGEQQLAQIGFIVIQVGHRGGTPNRSKAYASYGYFNLRDYGLADKRAAIEQLAARHSFIDIQRVGVYGHSGGAFMTAAAMLQTPYNDFFKVGVATSGNHDNNVYGYYWAERYHGLREVAVTDEKTQGA